MSNRLDVRTESQFKKYIKESHVKEAEIAVRICIKEHAKTGKWVDLWPTGCDMTGNFINDSKKVSSSPDFLINHQLVEITRSDVVCRTAFHEKCHKVERCIRDNTDLVFVNGFVVEKQPQYIRLSGKELEPYLIRSTTKYGKVWLPGSGKTGPINKPAYKFDLYWFKDLWEVLPVLIDNIPENYKQIITATKV